ncbi:MAG TPA: phosphatase PAP2 family protein [Candidatus Eisenbacteria bacterium]|jgi:undecaprenyl-diphosphatase
MLSDWDVALFRAIHHGLHHPWLDPVMMALTDIGPWKIPLLVLIAGLLLLRGRRGAIAVVVLALTIAAADQLSSHVLKPIFRRARPSVSLHDSKPLFGIRTSWSFPSTHASNFFSAAPVIAAAVPQAAVAAYALATAVSLSRVYVGDHYPSDVLGGAILGLFLGFLGRKAFLRAERSLPGGARASAGADEDVPIRESRGERAPSGGP